MRKLALFSGSFALAAALYVYGFRDVRALWVAGACGMLSFFGQLLGFRRVAVAALGAAVGVCYSAFYQQVFLAEAWAADGTEQQISVRLSESPVRTDYGDRVTGIVTLSGRSYETIIYGDGEMAETEAGPGDTISCMASVKTAVPAQRETADLYRMSRGVFLCVYPTSAVTVEPGTPTLPQQIALWLQRRIDALYDGAAAGLVRALLTGNREGLDASVQNDLSVTGISHAVAVSGMHVSMLMALVSMLSGKNPRLTALLGIPATVLFAVMTGASPSVCRAAIMQLLLLTAPLLHRETDGFTTLGAAALVLLIENPWAIASVSFQLSFAAVAGLFLLADPIQQRILKWKRKPGPVLRFVASGVSATLSASALTVPLTVYYFGMISIAAPLTNLLCLWAVTGIFLLGLISCCLGPAGPVLAWIVTALSRYMLGICNRLAAFPYAAAYPQNMPLMVWTAAAYALALAALLWKQKLPVVWLLSGQTAAFLGCILWGRWEYTRYPWRFTALDVGQGQCLVLQLEDYTAVVDCGGSDPEEAGEKLVRYFHSAGITHIDALILTHYDQDHCGGAERLLERIRTDTVFLPAKEDPSGVKALLEAGEAQTFSVESQMEIRCAGGSLVLYPPIFRENDTNNGVCVLARAKECDMLIIGDLDQYAEMRLLSRWELPQVDVLVAGHHGAKDSTSQVLLDTVQPETVIISVGENAYGHPAGETLERIQDARAEVLRTDKNGTIILKPRGR